jgi:DNA-binding protein YbaB
MSSPVDPSGIEHLVSQTLRTLNQARGATAKTDDGAEPAEPLRGYGEAADGLVRVTAAAGGRLEELQLDPRVMRMSTVSLAEEIVSAANAALADLQGRIREGAAGPDLDGLTERLKEVREQSVPQLRKFLQALTDAQARIAVAGGR